MLRILRAFAWMRWRILANSLQKVSARDAVQRFSLALEPLLPALVLALMIPGMIALAVAGAFTGFQAAMQGPDAFALQIVRYILFGAVMFSLVGPILLPGADRSNPVRLLLLPIPARVLYVAQAAGAVSDLWVALMMPLLLALPIGLAAGGRLLMSLLALASSVLLILILIGLSALATTAMHLLLRNRRRGELVALAMIFVVAFSGFLPALVGSSRSRQRRPLPAWAMPIATRALAAAPSEIYVSTIESGLRSGTASAGAPLLLLFGVAVVTHGFGLVLFRRVLSTPGTVSSRTVSASGIWSRRLPGVSPVSSAVAMNLFRLVLRTPRGRSILLGPVMMILLLTFLTRPSRLTATGAGLAAFTAFFSLLSTLPISMNQFAVDGAGLTMALLAPIETKRLLVGKATGTGLVAFLPALFCLGFAAIVRPGGPIGLWLAVPVALIATLTLAAPVEAVLSAVFARAVDMNSVGRRGNAHGLAGLAGMFSFVVSALPCVLLTWLAIFLERPSLAPLFVLGWCGLALLIATLLFIPAEKIFDARRESLVMLMGRSD